MVLHAVDAWTRGMHGDLCWGAGLVMERAEKVPRLLWCAAVARVKCSWVLGGGAMDRGSGGALGEGFL